jgi:hypothetical protein
MMKKVIEVARQRQSAAALIPVPLCDWINNFLDTDCSPDHLAVCRKRSQTIVQSPFETIMFFPRLLASNPALFHGSADE